MWLSFLALLAPHLAPYTCEYPDSFGRCAEEPTAGETAVASARAREHGSADSLRCRRGRLIPGGVLYGTKIEPFCLDTTEVSVEDFHKFLRTHERVATKDAAEIRSRLLTIQWNRVPESKVTFDANCNYQYLSDKERKKHPINCVSRKDAEKFCKARGAGWRLPSDYEWEWAARGGKEGFTYPWGKDPPGPELLNSCDVDCQQIPGNPRTPMHQGSDRYPTTAPVGSFRIGYFRLYDMAGNVGEWVACAEGAQECVVRGGSFRTVDPSKVTTTYRNTGDKDDTRSDETGFRCAGPPRSAP